jgi:hypothetical protein
VTASTKESGRQSLGGDQRSAARKLAEFLGRVVVFFAALGVFSLSVLLLLNFRRGTPVAAPFTRVGGATHVETAVDASRFWLTPPQYVVETPDDNEGEQVMLDAAQCAMANDAPLLFTSNNETRKQLVMATVDAWHHGGTAQHPKYPIVIPFDEPGQPTSCPAPTGNEELSTLAAANKLLSLPGIQPQDNLAGTVVFAATWEPDFSPMSPSAWRSLRISRHRIVRSQWSSSPDISRPTLSWNRSSKASSR